jgi:putative heme-binding domain-containing protein
MSLARLSAVVWLAAVIFLSLALPGVAADPTEKLWVYVGTYTGKESKGIYRCEFDQASGKLTAPVLVAETVNPTFLTIHPSGKFLYAVGEIDNFGGKKAGAVNAYAIDPKTGDLKLLNQQSSGGQGPCHVSLDKGGKHVLVANYTGGSVAVLPIKDDGSLGEATAFVQHQGKSVDKDRQEGPHAHSINLDRANKYAIAADLGLDKLLVYKYDARKGTLTPNDPPAMDTAPGAGPRHFSFHPDGKHAYACGELDSTVMAMDYDAGKGVLTKTQTLSTLPAPHKGNSTAECIVHPSGKFVYVSNRGHDSIAVFKVDPATGQLTAAGHGGKGFKVPRNFNIDPSGKWMIVAGQDSNNLCVFEINPQTGELKPTDNTAEVGHPVCVRFLAKAAAKPAGAAAGSKDTSATPGESLKIAKDFKAELLYSVPKDVQGSWVNMTVDPKGRLIVSDQYGPLYRITPPPVGGRAEDTKVEKLPIALGGSHGLLWAFDSLYVMVNEGVNVNGARPQQGLHRVRSRDGGDTFEKPEFLRAIHGGGEHGVHAVLPGPDGKSLYVVVGDATQMMKPLDGSRVPQLWGEDHLLPRMPDGNGFMRGVLGPGGCIYKTDPDGKHWELVSTGYRNEFDAAFNRDGELFTYDADMEWDMNTPWYRPTRVCLATSGSEFGWRNGAGKWPPYYPDSLPAIYNVGPGSPTGMCFGYGAKFPAKYQDALYMCDWSYGKLYALHLTPEGSAYKGELEEFASGTPLQLTDVVVNPKDGALYFTIGGRKTQSGLYRVTYVGKESTTPSQPDSRGAEARALRHSLEEFHGRQDPKAVDAAWPYLGHEDRYIRFAARVAIEHQDPKTWQARALAEKDPAASLGALLALVRATMQDPFHHPRKDGDPVPGVELKAPVLEALARLDWDKLTHQQRLDLLRIYAILFNRAGKPDEVARQKLIARFDPLFPSKSRELNAELCQMLVYLEAPGIARKSLKMMAEAPTQEEQLEYARALRVLRKGWSLSQRSEYFTWFQKAAHFKGGASLRGFLNIMLDDAVDSLSEAEKAALLKSSLRTQMSSAAATATPTKARPFVKEWKLDELTPAVEKGLKTKRDFDRGRTLFGQAQCFACHRFDNEGGAQGPDLTGISGRFNVRDLLESILDPSKEISDQYAAVTFTLTDGKTVTGRIVNHHDNNIMVMTDMLDPNGLVNVNAKKVESTQLSKVSMMPKGLLDTFKEDEILDLVAYLMSRGDRNNKMFK